MLPVPFVDNESETHREAKLRLANWLAEAPEAKVGRYRVAVEYPFTKCGLGVLDWCVLGHAQPPTYAELRQAGKMPIYICDIVVIENNRVTHAIEVFHTNPIADDKIRWLKSYDITTHEAYAAEVMALKEPPMDIGPMLREQPLRPIPWTNVGTA